MRRLLLATSVVIVVAGPIHAAAPPREVNVTSESTPGWVPSVELEQAARAAAAHFFDARDGRRYAEAYALLSDLNRGDSADEFAQRAGAFNNTAGALRERRITKLTWSKDPKSAPAPGVYVAVDFVGRYEGVDRYCGYLMLHQAGVVGPFRVMRSQEASVDNATAAAIVRKQSVAALDAAWAQAARGCPTYTPPLTESATSDIGYPDVATALAALRQKPGVTFTVDKGWTIATEQEPMTLWSFAPPGHPAYPAVVRRTVTEEGGSIKLGMSVQCEASKAACDDLVREFERLNRAVMDSARGRR